MAVEYNYKKKITYYLGAGASANSIPMVSGINQSLKDLCEFIRAKIGYYGNDAKFTRLIGTMRYDKKEFVEFKSFLDRWTSLVIPTPSIDTFAKRLFDNDKKEEYAEYKIFLTIAFHYFHFSKRINDDVWGNNILDGRYENLFRSINNERKEYDFKTFIPKCFKFITWNYDFQFEFSRVLDYSDEGQPQFAKINAFYKSMEGQFLKLNGNSLLDKLENLDYSSRLNLNTQEDLLDLLFLIYYELINNEQEITTFRFSWENKVDLESLSWIAQKTDILVVIGYSFPSFNRMIDKAFYMNLKKDCVIYTQGRDMQDSIRIKNYFEQCFAPARKPENVIPVESPFFFVPPQYFDPEEQRHHHGIVSG